MGDQLADIRVHSSIEVRFENEDRLKPWIFSGDHDSRHMQRGHLRESKVGIRINLVADIRQQLVERIEILAVDCA